MADENDRLVERLQRHINRLQQVQLQSYNDELKQAVADLRHELDDLKIIAPHVYGIPPKARL